MKIKNIFFFLSLFILFSCQNDLDNDMNESDVTDPLTNENEESRSLLEGECVIKIRLTDGPIDLQAVNIDIIGMHIIGDSTKYNLSTVNGIYNLLDFQNGIDTLISVDTFMINFLKDIVLELGENNTIIDKNGDVHPLEFPSNNRDFLKIKFNQKLDSLQLSDVQLDFDACKSVHQTGNGRWILKPVIKINRFNDHPHFGNFDLLDDKLKMIELSYPDYDKFEIKQVDICFSDKQLIEVFATSTINNNERVFLLNTNCEELYVIETTDFLSLSDEIQETAKNAINGNPEFFNEVLVYNQSNSLKIYGFTAIKGQGNSAKEIKVYVDEMGVIICKE